MERRGLNIRKGVLGAVLPVLRRLPLPLASRMVAGIGRIEYALFPELRSAFDAAVARGQVLPAHWLFRRGYAVRFYMERPRHVSKYLTRQFATEGPLGQSKLFISRSKGDPAGSASSILRASKVLGAGMIIYLAGDVRWNGPNTQVARFMGQLYHFSATLVRLAALTGAPVVPVFCPMLPDGTSHIDFRPPLHIPQDVARNGQVLPWVQSYLQTLEDEVRRHPDNSNEYFFWPESDEFAAPEERAA
jgi:hypothetical protein